jgi:putative NADH-flavin reductase
MMKTIVFGATGGTGQELVRQALDQGHDVTAFVRGPKKIADIEHANLAVARGDVLDVAAVEVAVPEHEAVLCAIGAGAQRTTLRQDGRRNIIAAMEEADVSRLNERRLRPPRCCPV